MGSNSFRAVGAGVAEAAEHPVGVSILEIWLSLQIRGYGVTLMVRPNPNNEFWDDSFGEFKMGDYSYPASEILFNVDKQAYVNEYKVYTETEE